MEPPSHVVNPILIKSLPYDTINDFLPVTNIMNVPLVLIVSSKAPWTSLQQLLSDAKNRPGTLSIGSSEGSSLVTGEMFKQRAGVNILAVPYKGSGPMMTDLVGGHVSMGFIPVSTALGPLKSGNIKVLAVAGSKRNAAMPDIPTFAEFGVPFEAHSWTGVFAPAKTPAAIANRIQADFIKVVADPALRDKITLGAAEISLERPEEFQKFVLREIEQWRAVANKAGLKPE